MKIKLSKKQWEMIGKQAGWMNKKAQVNPYDKVQNTVQNVNKDVNNSVIKDTSNSGNDIPSASATGVSTPMHLTIDKLKENISMIINNYNTNMANLAKINKNFSKRFSDLWERRQTRFTKKINLIHVNS